MILQESLLQKVIDAALSGGADFAEVYVEDTYSSNFRLQDSKPSQAVVGQLYGAGIRLFYGAEQIYTYTNDLSEASLIQVATTAAKAMSGPQVIKAQALTESLYDSIHEYGRLPWEMDKSKKLAFLNHYDKAARGFSSLVSQVVGVLSETHKKVQVANSLGLNVSETRNYMNTMVQVIAEDQGVREVGMEREASLTTNEMFETLNFDEMGKRAADQAVRMIQADYAPAAEMPVVIDNGFGGVIFHEACGHGLETTSVAKNASVFCDRLDTKVAESCVTAIDDGTISNSYGSLSMDDEGQPTQKTTLIENGILKSYLVDQMGSIKTGYKPTGSGRRQDYRFAPTSRMRNTYIDAGDSTLEEMIKDIDYGLYAKKMGGGSVTPGTGDYNFSVQEGYLVRNGKIEKPVKGASLIGSGIDTLSKITKVGNELKLAPGSCGSASGWVPVTVGQPAVLVSKLVVGGRA